MFDVAHDESDGNWEVMMMESALMGSNMRSSDSLSHAKEGRRKRGSPLPLHGKKSRKAKKLTTNQDRKLPVLRSHSRSIPLEFAFDTLALDNRLA